MYLYIDWSVVLFINPSIVLSIDLSINMNVALFKHFIASFYIHNGAGIENL